MENIICEFAYIYKFISTPPRIFWIIHLHFWIIHLQPPKNCNLVYTLSPQKIQVILYLPPKKWYLMSPPFFIPPPPPLGAHTLIQKMHLFPQILVREGAKNTLQGEGGAVFRGLRPFISIPPAFFSYLSSPPTFLASISPLFILKKF